MAHKNERAARPRKRATKALHSVLLNLPVWLRPKLGQHLVQAQSKDKFLARVEGIFPKTSKEYLLIERAYDTAQRTFRNVTRDNGEQYFEHLRASALFALAHLRVRNAHVIAAILLHDIVEDFRKLWNFDRIRAEFGDEVAELVYWVTKPEVGPLYRTKADVIRKYHRQLRHAPRNAVIVKLCERLHNLITIWEDDAPRTRLKVAETRDVHLQLAEDHCVLLHEMEDVIRLIEKRIGT